MALAHCILGKFLGVVCHCFPPPVDIPTFAARCLYVRNDARDLSSERWNCGLESCPVILHKFRLPRKFWDLLHAANLRPPGSYRVGIRAVVDTAAGVAATKSVPLWRMTSSSLSQGTYRFLLCYPLSHTRPVLGVVAAPCDPWVLRYDH